MREEAGLLEELGRAGREPDVLSDPRWEAFAAGTLPDDERERLVSAARAAGLSDEEIEAFGPRTEEHDDALADAVLGAAKDGAAAKDGTPAEDGAPQNTISALSGDAAVRGAPARPGTPRARPSRRATWPFAAAGVLAAAAAAALLVRPPEEARWPAYALAVEGGARDTRSMAPGAAPLFFPDSRVTLVARPAKAVRWQAEARAFLSAGRTGELWQVPAEVAEGGSARITGRAGDLFAGVPSGLLEVCVVTGSPAAVRDMVVKPDPPGPDAHYALVCGFVSWQPEGAPP